MKVFLDRCVPKRLCRYLASHECTHASQVAWGQESNGRLILAATEAGFEAMITVDANMPHQTMLGADALPVILMVVRKNDLDHLLPSLPRTLDVIPRAARGTYTIVPLLEERPAE